MPPKPIKIDLAAFMQKATHREPYSAERPKLRDYHTSTTQSPTPNIINPYRSQAQMMMTYAGKQGTASTMDFNYALKRKQQDYGDIQQSLGYAA